MCTVLTWVVIRFQHSTFPILQLLFDFVGIDNVHALVSIMEVVPATRQNALVVPALQLRLRGALGYAPAIVVQGWHLQALRSLTQLIGNGALARLVLLHHVYLCEVVLLVDRLVAATDVVVLLLLVRAALARQVVGQVAGRVDRHVVPDGAAATVQALLTPLIAGHVV